MSMQKIQNVEVLNDFKIREAIAQGSKVLNVRTHTS